MSIKVDSSGVIINNANGTEKFNSSSKLLYRKFSQSGSLSIPASTRYVTDIALDGTFNPDNNVALVFINPTAASGNVANQVIGSNIQLSFSMLTNFKHSTTSVYITEWDMLTAAVIGDLSSATLRIQHIGFTAGRDGPAVSSISFDWNLVVLSYR